MNEDELKKAWADQQIALHDWLLATAALGVPWIEAYKALTDKAGAVEVAMDAHDDKQAASGDITAHVTAPESPNDATTSNTETTSSQDSATDAGSTTDAGGAIGSAAGQGQEA